MGHWYTVQGIEHCRYNGLELCVGDQVRTSCLRVKYRGGRTGCSEPTGTNCALGSPGLVGSSKFGCPSSAPGSCVSGSHPQPPIALYSFSIQPSYPALSSTFLLNPQHPSTCHHIVSTSVLHLARLIESLPPCPG